MKSWKSAANGWIARNSGDEKPVAELTGRALQREAEKIGIPWEGVSEATLRERVSAW